MRRYYSHSDVSRYRGQSSASSGYNESHQEYVEVTLDVREDDSVCVNSVRPLTYEDPGKSLLGQDRPVVKKSSSVFKRLTSSASNELKRVAPSVSLTEPPRPPRARLPRSESKAEQNIKGLRFITNPDGVAGWPGVEKKFDELAEKTNRVLHRSQFGACIGIVSIVYFILILYTLMRVRSPPPDAAAKRLDEKKKNKSTEWSKSSGFALALFDGLAKMHNISGGVINKDQLLTFWEQINNQDFGSRLQIFFAMFDKDEDGLLNEDDVREIITLSASANNLDKIRDRADEYAALIMEELDPNDCGYITIESLEVLLLQAPIEAVRNAKSKELSMNLSQEIKVSASRNLWERLFRGMMYSALNNWKRVWVMALWIAVMTGLFTWKFLDYRKRSAYQVMGACVCIAKGAGETLKLNMAIVLLPVCRNTITWLRTKTKLSVVVPFNDNLNFHKVIAIAISIGVGIHATAHLACDFPRLIAADEETYKPMEQYFGVQPKSYVEFLKSIEVITGTVMVILMTISFTLATSWLRRYKEIEKLPQPWKTIIGFNAFWYTHHLFVIVYTLLVVHGYYVYLIKTWYRKTTWMYLMVPVVLYLSERLVRSLRSRVESVEILKAVVLPGKLLLIHTSKPNNFKYISGQYMYLKCSAVSSLEWHPFSISSAPGDEYLSVHIKGAGDWTNSLLKKLDKERPRPDEHILNRAGSSHRNSHPSWPKLLIDGPYGAPSQDYKNYEVVLLVGLGIGVTPMISIVKDIINNIEDNEDEEEGRGRRRNQNHTRKDEKFKTTKAYFYWSTRYEETFDWFQSVMDEVAESDRNKVVELHNCFTGIHQAADARSSLITMLQSLYYAKNERDVLSGTRVMSHFSRPNWRSVYKRITVKHPNTRVGVFYCGLPGGVPDQRYWSTYFSRKTRTEFCFHKENF